MKKRVQRSSVWGGIAVAFLVWSATAAQAVVRPPPVSPFDDDGRIPAAPEPAEILMLASGLALVGGFVTYHMFRRRR